MIYGWERGVNVINYSESDDFFLRGGSLSVLWAADVVVCVSSGQKQQQVDGVAEEEAQMEAVENCEILMASY